MTVKKKWSYEAGVGDSRVVVEEVRGILQLRWWDKKKTPPNWTTKSLGRALERDGRGRVLPESEAAAVGDANQKSVDLASGRQVVAGKERGPLTIGETEALIVHKDYGKYPHRTQGRDELVRAIRYAVALWGADTPWTKIEDAEWTMLMRRRLEGLLAEGHSGWRATEITLGRLITVVRWLRAKKHIPRDAAPWPESYKADIVVHWKGIKKTARDPEPNRPRHTLEEVRAILAASVFSLRFDLLMWLGMELRLGQVARMQRTDLNLPTVDWNAEPMRDPKTGEDLTDYGTQTIYGSGKKGVKGGVITDLTRVQRFKVEFALREGYLADIEKQYQAGTVADYCIFPSGYEIGRVARDRGKDVEQSLGHVDFETSVGGSWIRKTFRDAEERAGVEHVRGRCGYGVRRQGRDFADEAGLSRSATENWGTWTPGSTIPDQVYRNRANRVGRREARGARARFRNEDDVVTQFSEAPPAAVASVDVAENAPSGDEGEE